MKAKDTNIESSFIKILNNNVTKDWNDVTVRGTMVNAFLYCAIDHKDRALKEQAKEIFQELEDVNILYKETKKKFLK